MGRANWRDPFAPAWDLRVNGEPIPDDVRAAIRSITAELTVDGADELTIEADAWNSLARRWILVSETTLAPGNLVVLLTGYGHDLAAVQRFRVVGHEASYPADGAPTVKVRALSGESWLVERTEPRVFEGPISDSEIVREIADASGLRTTATSVDETPVRAGGRTKKKGATDLEFLQELATANDFGPPVVLYDPDTGEDVLYFRRTRIEHAADVLDLVYDPHLAASGDSSGDLLSFSPELNLADTPTKVRVTGYDPESGQVVEVTIGIADSSREQVIYRGRPTDVEDFGDPIALRVAVLQQGDGKGDAPAEEVVAVGEIRDVDGARAYARRWIADRRRAFMRARAEVLGDPRIRLGSVHRVSGVAPTHAGLWEVEAVTHQIGTEYRCDLDLSRVLESAREPYEVPP